MNESYRPSCGSRLFERVMLRENINNYIKKYIRDYLVPELEGNPPLQSENDCWNVLNPSFTKFLKEENALPNLNYETDIDIGEAGYAWFELQSRGIERPKNGKFTKTQSLTIFLLALGKYLENNGKYSMLGTFILKHVGLFLRDAKNIDSGIYDELKGIDMNNIRTLADLSKVMGVSPDYWNEFLSL